MTRDNRLAGAAPLRATPVRTAALCRNKTGVVRAGVDDVMGDFKKAIAENKAKLERAKFVASPPGVPPPPVIPVLEPGKVGFVENAERWNSRASMVGWWSLLLVELIAGKGLLEIMGFTVGKGINFTF